MLNRFNVLSILSAASLSVSAVSEEDCQYSIEVNSRFKITVKDGVELVHHSALSTDLRDALLHMYCKILKENDKIVVEKNFVIGLERDPDLFSYENVLLDNNCRPSKTFTSAFPYGHWFLLDATTAEGQVGIIHIESLPEGVGKVQGKIFRINYLGQRTNQRTEAVLEFQNFAINYLDPALISSFREISEEWKIGPRFEILEFPEWEIRSQPPNDKGQNLHIVRTTKEVFRCAFDKSNHPSIPECQEHALRPRLDNFLLGSLGTLFFGATAYALKDKISGFFNEFKKRLLPNTPKGVLPGPRDDGKTRRSRRLDSGSSKGTYYNGELLLTPEEEEAIARSEQDVMDHEKYLRTREQQLQRERTTNPPQKLKTHKTGNTQSTQKDKKTQKTVSNEVQLPMAVLEGGIVVTENFAGQFLNLPEELQNIVRARISRIYGKPAHYGDINAIHGYKEQRATYGGRPALVYELRFKSGLRIYFVVINGRLLFDRIGNKNTQDKDIERTLRAFFKRDVHEDMDKLLKE